jgi:hypothetical protein
MVAKVIDKAMGPFWVSGPSDFRSTFVFGEGSSIIVDLWFCMGFPGRYGEGDKKTKFSHYW